MYYCAFVLFAKFESFKMVDQHDNFMLNYFSYIIKVNPQPLFPRKTTSFIYCRFYLIWVLDYEKKKNKISP